MYVFTCTYTYINVKLNIKYAFSLVVFFKCLHMKLIDKIKYMLNIKCFSKNGHKSKC